jgi:hypothetical protein
MTISHVTMAASLGDMCGDIRCCLNSERFVLV